MRYVSWITLVVGCLFACSVDDVEICGAVSVADGEAVAAWRIDAEVQLVELDVYAEYPVHVECFVTDGYDVIKTLKATVAGPQELSVPTGTHTSGVLFCVGDLAFVQYKRASAACP